MQAVVGGNIRYANLQSICDQFRAQINDTANNTTGSGVGTGNQAGVIMPNSNPDLLTLLTAATQDTYAELRNVGDPELILDYYDLFQLPPVNSNLGPGSLGPNEIVNLPINPNDYIHAYYSGVFRITLCVPDTYTPGELIGIPIFITGLVLGIILSNRARKTS